MGQNKLKLTVAILLMSFVQMGTNGIAPILAQIADTFPEKSPTAIQFLMTFPAIFMVILAFLSALLSEKIPQKKLAISGLILVAAGGVLACTFHGSYGILMVWAAFLGIGIGLVSPVAPALVNRYYEGAERGKMLGWQNSASTIGSMLMTFAGGFLALAGWNYGYLVYLIAIPGIIATAVGLKGEKEDSPADRRGEKYQRDQLFQGKWQENPSKDADRKRARKEDTNSRSQDSGIRNLQVRTLIGEFRSVLPWMLTAFCFLTCFSYVPANIAMAVEEKGVGGTAFSGILSTLYSLGGMLMGLVYGYVAEHLHRYSVLVGGIMLAAGAGLLAVSTSIPALILASLLGGASISLVMPTCMGTAVKVPKHTNLATAVILCSGNLGIFIAPVITTAADGIFHTHASGHRLVLVTILACIFSIIYGCVITMDSSLRNSKRKGYIR